MTNIYNRIPTMTTEDLLKELSLRQIASRRAAENIRSPHHRILYRIVIELHTRESVHRVGESNAVNNGGQTTSRRRIDAQKKLYHTEVKP